MMLDSIIPGETPEVMQTQLAAFSHALVSTKGEVQCLHTSLQQLTKRVSEFEVRFEDVARTTDWAAHTEQLSVLAEKILMWRQGVEDELAQKQAHLRSGSKNSDLGDVRRVRQSSKDAARDEADAVESHICQSLLQEKVQDSAADMQQMFDMLCSRVDEKLEHQRDSLQAELAKHTEARRDQQATDHKYTCQMSEVLSMLDQLTQNVTRENEATNSKCESLDREVKRLVVCMNKFEGAGKLSLHHRPDIDMSASFPRIEQLTQRCDGMNATIAKALREVEMVRQEVSSISGVLKGHRREFMNGLAEVRNEIQAEKAVQKESLQSAQELRQSTPRAASEVSEEIRGLKRLVTEISTEMGTVKTSCAFLREQLLGGANTRPSDLNYHTSEEIPKLRSELKRVGELVYECQAQCKSLGVLPSELQNMKDLPTRLDEFTTVFTAGLKEVQGKMLNKMGQLEEFSTLFDAAASKESQSQDRSYALNERLNTMQKDVNDLFDILTALDCSKLNELHDKFELWSKELKSERQERRSEQEVLRSCVRNLESKLGKAATDSKQSWRAPVFSKSPPSPKPEVAVVQDSSLLQSRSVTVLPGTRSISPPTSRNSPLLSATSAPGGSVHVCAPVDGTTHAVSAAPPVSVAPPARVLNRSLSFTPLMMSPAGPTQIHTVRTAESLRACTSPVLPLSSVRTTDLRTSSPSVRIARSPSDA